MILANVITFDREKSDYEAGLEEYYKVSLSFLNPAIYSGQRTDKNAPCRVEIKLCDETTDYVALEHRWATFF